jgi:acetoacetyl-CoA reductase
MSDQKALAGKVALVTGASRGIGRATALALAKSGASVVVNYRSSEREANALVGEISALGGKAHAEQADVSRDDECDRLAARAIESFGQVDILVNNAGITQDHMIHRMTPEEWRAVIDTNLNSAFYMTHLLAGGMRERRYGRIVNIASMAGQVGLLGQANYSAAKGGMIALTKAVALELAPFNITVNALCPGYVETDLLASASEENIAAILARIPLKRFGRPEEVAACVRFLVTEADWMTGQQINLNGGQYM